MTGAERRQLPDSFAALLPFSLPLHALLLAPFSQSECCATQFKRHFARQRCVNLHLHGSTQTQTQAQTQIESRTRLVAASS